MIIAMAVALGIVGFVGVVLGRLVARSGRKARVALPASVLAGAFAAAALVALLGIASDLGDSSAYGYGSVTLLMFVYGPLALVGGSVLAQVAAVWAARHWRAEGTPAD